MPWIWMWLCSSLRARPLRPRPEHVEEERAQLLPTAVDAAPADLDLAVVGEQRRGLLPHAIVEVVAVDALQPFDWRRPTRAGAGGVSSVSQALFEQVDGAHAPKLTVPFLAINPRACVAARWIRDRDLEDFVASRKGCGHHWGRRSAVCRAPGGFQPMSSNDDSIDRRTFLHRMAYGAGGVRSILVAGRLAALSVEPRVCTERESQCESQSGRGDHGRQGPRHDRAGDPHVQGRSLRRAHRRRESVHAAQAAAAVDGSEGNRGVRLQRAAARSRATARPAARGRGAADRRPERAAGARGLPGAQRVDAGGQHGRQASGDGVVPRRWLHQRLGLVAALRRPSLCTRGDVVVVTINHRLGVLGFTHLGELAGESSRPPATSACSTSCRRSSGCATTSRSSAATRARVTIFGESGGGRKVSTLLAMPAATGAVPARDHPERSRHPDDGPRRIESGHDCAADRARYRSDQGARPAEGADRDLDRRLPQGVARARGAVGSPTRRSRRWWMATCCRRIRSTRRRRRSRRTFR